MSDALAKLAADALVREFLARGWKYAATRYRFDRVLKKPFAATAWVSVEPEDDDTVVVEPSLWLACPKAEEALIGLERAVAASALGSVRGAYVAVRVDGTRVSIEGEPVGSVSGAAGAARTVPGEIVGGALRVQLPE